MILCIDSGNSRIKWGLHDDGRWLEAGVIAHADADQLASLAYRLPPASIRRLWSGGPQCTK